MVGSDKAVLRVSHHVSREDDRFVRGGYAVFQPGYDPEQRATSRPVRMDGIVFAGEHASLHWRGYMNGAVRKRSASGAGGGGLQTAKIERPLIPARSCTKACITIVHPPSEYPVIPAVMNQWSVRS